MALVKYNDNSISAISSAGQLATGSLVPIKTLTASDSASLSFVDGSNDVVLDSTYPIYKFEFINIQSGDENAGFAFQVDTGTNTNYNQTITSTAFNTYHHEGDSYTALEYRTDADQAQGTSFNDLSNYGVTADQSDSSLSGYLHIYNPSSTTFVKHFIANTQIMNGGSPNYYSLESFHAGYFNTTSALTRFKFKFASGNIDAGQILLFGVN